MSVSAVIATDNDGVDVAAPAFDTNSGRLKTTSVEHGNDAKCIMLTVNPPPNDLYWSGGALNSTHSRLL